MPRSSYPDREVLILSFAGGSRRDCSTRDLKSRDKDSALDIVRRAPVAGGGKAMKEYMSRTAERCGNQKVQAKMKSLRRHVQDKSSGVMLQPGFIGSLKWPGPARLTFDISASRSGRLPFRSALCGRCASPTSAEMTEMAIMLPPTPPRGLTETGPPLIWLLLGRGRRRRRDSWIGT